MIVIDIDMPKSCFECVYALTDAHGAYCALADNEIKEGIDIYEGTNNRSAICPIKCNIEDIKTEIADYILSDDEKTDMDEDSIKWGIKIAYDIIDKHTKGDTDADSN